MSTPTPSDLCPACGYCFDRAKPVSGKQGPRPGNFSICFSCGAWLRFGDDLRVRSLTSEDEADLDVPTRAALETLIIAIRARGPISQPFKTA